MPRPVSNPPNPWASTHVEWLDEPPPPATLEVFEEDARSILAENDSPDIGFRYSLNPYRGCFHACAYCLAGDTPILMADGGTRALRDLKVGDAIYGTEVRGPYRRYVVTRVLAHWATMRRAYRVTLADGTRLVASADHRFLTERGWKHVAVRDRGQRPHLTAHNRLLGVGRLARTPAETDDYRRGYLEAIVRAGELEVLSRVRRFTAALGAELAAERAAAVAVASRTVAMVASSSMVSVSPSSDRGWPADATTDQLRGFLAGAFDVDGSYRRGILRFTSRDRARIDRIARGLDRLGFDRVIEPRRGRLLCDVRVRGGLPAHLRFFHTVDPAVTRKRAIDGVAVKHDVDLGVAAVEPLGIDVPMYDITTGTGDFIADGVISHNCYARPSHQYLGFGAGTDFDRKIVVKRNAPELLRETFDRKSWQGDLIAFSGDTDCYQPLEVSYSLTRRCLEICAEYQNPVGVITKSTVIRRDVDILARLAAATDSAVTLSIAFADLETARKIEPHASPPARRFETLRILSDAGIRTGINIAPVIPGLNESHIPELLERAHAAGARHASIIPLRLPAEVLPVFRERINETLPAERVRRIEHAIQEMRGGNMNDPRFNMRFRGQGERWRAIESLFTLHCRRLSLNLDTDAKWPSGPSPFRRPRGQLPLF